MKFSAFTSFFGYKDQQRTTATPKKFFHVWSNSKLSNQTSHKLYGRQQRELLMKPWKLKSYVIICISFSRCSSLDICLFTYVFSCSPSRSLHHILPILVSSLTFLRVFSRLALRLLLLVFFGRSVSFFSSYFHVKNPLSTNLKHNNFLLLIKL